MNKEEKILEMLEKLTVDVGRHGETLNKLTVEVDRHGEMLEELDDRSLRSAVMVENEVLPKLQLLYEGHVHLQETLAPKERVEVLEEEVITLKSAVKMMTKRLNALEELPGLGWGASPSSGSTRRPPESCWTQWRPLASTT